MSQDTAKPWSYNQSIEIGDTRSMNAFGRLRVADVVGKWDSQLTYDLQPLLYEQITNGVGASIAHDSTNRCALMTFSATPTGGETTMQSYDYIRYNPGKSKLIYLSFNFVESAANVLKFIGYSNGSNGIEFQDNGTTMQWVVYSDTSVGDQTVTQANWNIDKLDGTGPSGITLDIASAQLAIIDFQALYVGRVRVGFVINGLTYYVHEFLFGNSEANGYMQTANLPVRAGMTCTNTVSTTMRFICAAVATEGQVQDYPAYNFTAENSVSAGNGTRTHVLSIRPKTTFNGIVNRSKFRIQNINMLVSDVNPVYWELCIGQALTTPSYADVNATYSAFEYDTAGTLSGSPAIVIASGYVAASNQSKGAVNTAINTRYPITLDAAGANRNLGTLTLLAQGIGAASNFHASINFTEER